MSAISCILFGFFSSLCIDELFLHMVENISLTYAKFSCSLVMIDSSFSHAMKMCTIYDSPKGTSFFLRLFVSKVFG
jgi:hypothetical protein